MIPSVCDSSWNAVDHLGIGDRHVASAPDRREVRVLGTDARIVEPGGDRLGLEDLAVLVLQRYDFMPCTTPGTPCPIAAPPAGSTPDQHRLRVDEPGEDACSVRAPADARDDDVGWRRR